MLIELAWNKDGVFRNVNTNKQEFTLSFAACTAKQYTKKFIQSIQANTAVTSSQRLSISRRALQYQITIFPLTEYDNQQEVTRPPQTLNVVVQKHNTPKRGTQLSPPVVFVIYVIYKLPPTSSQHCNKTRPSSLLVNYRIFRNLSPHERVSPADSLARHVTARASDSYKIGQRSKKLGPLYTCLTARIHADP